MAAQRKCECNRCGLQTARTAYDRILEDMLQQAHARNVAPQTTAYYIQALAEREMVRAQQQVPWWDEVGEQNLQQQNTFWGLLRRG